MELYETFYAIAQWKAQSLIPHPKAEGGEKSGPMRCDGLNMFVSSSTLFPLKGGV